MRSILIAVLTLAAAPLAAQPTAPVATPTTGPATSAFPTRADNLTIRDFPFASGERIDSLRLHYTTLGTPRRDRAGKITNAVMVLHGTGGSGAQFFQPQFQNTLFGPGQPLDITRFYIILPDGIGHGRSSKPSDGLRMRFPRYGYTDMVEGHRRLLAHLGVGQLRLLMGTSMGCMHIFTWATQHPGEARALMPMACQAVEIAGRNRVWRKLGIDAIKADPAWAGGDYTAQPVAGQRTAAALSIIAGMNALRAQAEMPTRAAAEAWLNGRIEARMAPLDANDTIYQLDSSRDYDPAAGLGRITVPVAWINSADDFINPPGLASAEVSVRQMPDATFRLLSETAETRGHGSHTWAEFWKDDLVALLARSER